MNINKIKMQFFINILYLNEDYRVYCLNIKTVEGRVTPVSVNKYAFGETNYGWTWNKLKSSVSVNKEVNL